MTDCPQADLHTPCPDSYAAKQSWALAMLASGHSQSRCPGCSLLLIWTGLKPIEPVVVHERACLNVFAAARTVEARELGATEGSDG